MKILSRLFPFAKPLHHFLPEYLIYTFFGILFGLVNFALLIPVLGLLFNNQPAAVPVAAKPGFHLSIAYFNQLFNYYFNAAIAQHGRFYALVFVCGIICACLVLSNIFRYLAVRVMLRLRLKIMSRLRNELYEKYVHQSLAFHHNHRKGELMMIMANEIQEIEASVVSPLQSLLRDPLVVVCYFIMLLYWSPILTLFTLVFLPVTGLAISALTKRLKKMGYFSQDMMGQMLNHADESISGIRQIQSYTAESRMAQRFRTLNDNFSTHSKSMYGRRELSTPVSEILGVIAVLMLIVFGGYLILFGKTTLTGQGFIAYLALYTQIIQPLKSISQSTTTLQRGIVACEKIFSTLDAPVAIANPQPPVATHGFSSAVDLRHVTFSYHPGQPVINDISFRVAKGQTVALVGQSGSGKSTLIDLISRFYDTDSGSISIDDVATSTMALQELRGLISIVSQDAFLFNESIHANIALARPEATREEVIAAATVANAHQFIGQMSQGYDTVVGERGVKLSGGQRQRISIARAILKNAPILILDEATSSLDTESERLVQDAINSMMKNKTSIVIAHRLSTVYHADEILVMQDGRIVERGTHQQLLQQAGYYQKLVSMQEIK